MTDKLKQIEQAVIEYHEALRRHEHGGVAKSLCMSKIEDILDIYFEPQHVYTDSQNQSPANSV